MVSEPSAEEKFSLRRKRREISRKKSFLREIAREAWYDDENDDEKQKQFTYFIFYGSVVSSFSCLPSKILLYNADCMYILQLGGSKVSISLFENESKKGAPWERLFWFKIETKQFSLCIAKKMAGTGKVLQFFVRFFLCILKLKLTMRGCDKKMSFYRARNWANFLWVWIVFVWEECELVKNGAIKIRKVKGIFQKFEN